MQFFFWLAERLGWVLRYIWVGWVQHSHQYSIPTPREVGVLIPWVTEGLSCCKQQLVFSFLVHLSSKERKEKLVLLKFSISSTFMEFQRQFKTPCCSLCKLILSCRGNLQNVELRIQNAECRMTRTVSIDTMYIPSAFGVRSANFPCAVSYFCKSYL